MNQQPHRLSQPTRRDFFSRVGDGFVGSAMLSLLAPDFASADPVLAKPHFAPHATSVIQMFMTGGPSHVDLLDPKPALSRHEGDLPRAFLDNVESVGAAGGLMPALFPFAKHGESGLEVSSLMPHLAKCVDNISVIRSMWTTDFAHETAVFMMHSGRNLKASPSMGSWVAYGLGSENRNLPAYVALDDPSGQVLLGKQNWQSGWLPPEYQGTRLRSEGTPLFNLKAAEPYPSRVLELSRGLLDRLARKHRADRPGNPELSARIESYELAARMQLSATEATNLSQESRATQQMYGLDNKVTASYGRRCLMARRLVERGVRFVQIYMNLDPSDPTGNPWDHHVDIKGNLQKSCQQTDQPVAALLMDLRQRGLLDSTLLMWGGEFGRLPLVQKNEKPGRDHGSDGFSVWLAGGGVRGGTTYGATDEFGYHAVQDRVSVHDLHATILHCLGIDHEELVYHHNGLDERLSGVEAARVLHDILL